MKTLRKLFTVIVMLAIVVFASNMLFASAIDSTGSGTVTHYLNFVWGIVAVLGFDIAVIRLLTRYRGFIGTAIKWLYWIIWALTWLEDKTNPNTPNIVA